MPASDVPGMLYIVHLTPRAKACEQDTQRRHIITFQLTRCQLYRGVAEGHTYGCVQGGDDGAHHRGRYHHL